MIIATIIQRDGIDIVGGEEFWNIRNKKNRNMRTSSKSLNIREFINIIECPNYLIYSPRDYTSIGKK